MSFLISKHDLKSRDVSAFIKILCLLSVFCPLLLSPAVFAAGNASISIYLGAPKDVSSGFANSVVETFEGFSTGVKTSNLTSTLGTYQLTTTAKAAIVTADQYGSGTGQYLSFGSQSSSSAPITLQFSTPQSYFGFSWNAGDNLNGITFYNGNNPYIRFSTAQILALLSPSTITAINGSTYNTANYKGNPSTGQNSSQPYSFIHFIASGATFSKVVFDNSSSASTGFETDNHTILSSGIATAQGTFVTISTVSLLPEPSEWITGGVIGIFLLTALVVGYRRTRFHGQYRLLLDDV